jgi:hypothetical protein
LTQRWFGLSFIGYSALLLGAGLLVAADLSALEPDPECKAPQRLSQADVAKRRQLVDQQREVLKTARYKEAAEIQRQIVGLQCNNRYQLYYLAELLLQAGDVAGAVEWLERLYDRQVNDLEERLANPKSPLHPLLLRQEFLQSALAREIATKRQEFELRRAGFVAKLDALTAEQRPPSDYVAEEVCPFECCTYREWTVLEDTEVVAAPGSTEVVGRALQGSAVLGLTGEVHLRPVAVAVVFPKSNFRPEILIPAGAIIFLLDYMGEGYRHVWYDGRVLSLPTVGEVQDHCPFPDEKCWGERLEPENEEEDYTWWVKIRLQDGTEAWTAEVNFGNIDACG